MVGKRFKATVDLSCFVFFAVQKTSASRRFIRMLWRLKSYPSAYNELMLSTSSQVIVYTSNYLSFIATSPTVGLGMFSC